MSSPLSRSPEISPGILVGLAAVGAALVLLAPAFSAPAPFLVGASESDAIRGAWSLQHVYRSLPLPLLSSRIHHPLGALNLPLPFVSAVLCSPFQALLGPFHGYALALAAMLAAAGAATAWWVRELCGSWAAGGLAGGVVMGQPMLLHALEDGTPEHLALWTLPAALAALTRATRTRSPRWSATAGILAATAVLEAPYLAIFTAVVLPFGAISALLRSGAPRRAAAIVRILLPALVVALAAALLVAWLYAGFDLQPPDTATDLETAVAGNSVDLRSWWMLEHRPEGDVLGNLPPALLPTVFLGVALAVAIVGLPRTLPLLAVGLFTLGLSLGPRVQNIDVLAWWGEHALGGAGRMIGETLGRAIVSFNRAWSSLPGLEGIRFPRRWLVPSALCLAAAAGWGAALRIRTGCRRYLGRFRAGPPGVGRPVDAVAGGMGLAGGLAGLLALQPYHGALPLTHLPEISFASWIRDHPEEGAVLLLPTVRPAPRTRLRDRVPVYADLDPALSSADKEYFQLLHGRPTYSFPALLTVQPRGEYPDAVKRLLHDADDLTVPHFRGTPPPDSTLEARWDSRRAEGRAWLFDAGFRFAVVDLGVYEGQWRERLHGFLEPVRESRTFSEGAGVEVLVLAPTSPPSP